MIIQLRIFGLDLLDLVVSTGDRAAYESRDVSGQYEITPEVAEIEYEDKFGFRG